MHFWMVLGIIYGTACWIANIVLCYRLADRKKRNAAGWAWLACLFGILTTLILAGLDASDQKSQKRDWMDDDVSNIR